jgi:DamX protein
MPKKHVLAISAVVVVAVAAAWLIPGRNKAPTTAGAPTEQAQLPLGKPTPNVEFANSGQPTNLPMVGQPVMRGPLAEEAGGISEGDDGVPVEGSSATPPTVTTTAPPAGVPAGQPAAKPAPTPAPAQVATAKPAPAAKPVAPAPVAKPAPAAKPAEKPVTVAKAGAAGSSWYTSQPTGNFVVQILGTSSEANAQAFVKEQGGEYRYFKKVLNGKPLFVITYGNFSSRAAAESAIKALPAKVQAGKPWPRTVASVQQELATTR